MCGMVYTMIADVTWVCTSLIFCSPSNVNQAGLKGTIARFGHGTRYELAGGWKESDSKLGVSKSAFKEGATSVATSSSEMTRLLFGKWRLVLWILAIR